MFKLFKFRIYRDRVFKLVETDLIEVHGKQRGGECVGMFATAILKAQEVGDMPNDLLERIKDQGFSVEEAAVAYLDASVTAIKKVTAGAAVSPDISSIVADMEVGIDKMFLKFQTQVIPRNGRAGPAMAQFSTDA